MRGALPDFEIRCITCKKGISEDPEWRGRSTVEVKSG